MAPQNQAAWLHKAKAPLQVGSAPYTAPGPDQLVVRSRALAINPLEWSKQDAGDMMYGWIKYPFVLGNDVAGEVVEVGSSVTAFKPGDRVLGLAMGMDPRSAKASEGAFQKYVVLRANVVSKIPESMSFERASVLPLCLSTAATGLFVDKYLGLRRPSVANYDRQSRDETKVHNGQVLVVWGASTAVGTNAVQLGVAAGYTVVATAGKRNFDYVRGLGASEVFDYRSKTCVQDIITTVKSLTARNDGDCVGAVSVGAGSVKPCIDILAACCKQKKGKYVAQISLNAPDPPKPGFLPLASWLSRAAWAWLSTLIKKHLKGVKVQFVWGSELIDGDVAKAIYGDFLPSALEQGSYVPKPEPQIVGHGLDQIQGAFELGKRGVSAKKLVVTV